MLFAMPSLSLPHCALLLQAKLPWFLQAQPSAACAKGGAGAYNDAIQVGGEAQHSAVQCSAVHRMHPPAPTDHC